MQIGTRFRNIFLFMTAAVALSACKVKETELVSQIKVLRPVTLKDKDGRAVVLPVGSASYAWNLLIVEQNNQKGLVLQSRDAKKTEIPFAVPADFLLGGKEVNESQTGQGVGIRQIQGQTLFVDNEPPTRTTETCDIVKSERVCDRDGAGHERCFDRTVTSSGRRDVVIKKGGYYQPLTVQLVQRNVVLVSLDLTLDETYENRETGPCL